MIKKEGIEIKYNLETDKIERIALIISNKICEAFPEHNFSKNDIYSILSNIDMYISKLPENSSVAKYSYKTNSIYLSDKLNLDNVDTLVIHECIHAIQGVINDKGNLIKLGLFDLSRNKGQGLNEAAVQFMASIATKVKTENVKYYNLNFQTQSPLYYPIETALINQIIYFIGSYSIFHSTIYGNNIFKNTFIAKCNQNIYEKLEKNFDLLLHYEELIEKNTRKISSQKDITSKVDKLIEKNNSIKSKIEKTTIETQNLIFENCFNYEFDLIRDKDSLDTFQQRLYNFSNFLISNESYTYYNNYYCEMMNKLEEKRTQIKIHGKITNLNNYSTDLLNLEQANYGVNFFKKLFAKIKILFQNAFIKENNN